MHERCRLEGVIAPFASKSSNLKGLPRRALSLAARSAVALDRFDEAAKLIERIREPKARDALELIASANLYTIKNMAPTG